jgi:hypothetical protein
MENERTIVDLKELKKDKRKAKVRELKAKMQEKLVAGCYWIRDNWEVVSVAGVAVAGVVGKGVKVLAQHHRLKAAQELKDRYIYDRSTGHYWHLRKTPTNADLLELERRRKDVGLGQALNDMRLL